MGGDTRTLEWIRALLKEHRTTLGAGNAADGSIETLRSICDRASHSLKRLLRLKGKLEMLDQSAAPADGGADTHLVVWDEKAEARRPMDIDDEDDEDDSGSS